MIMRPARVIRSILLGLLLTLLEVLFYVVCLISLIIALVVLTVANAVIFIAAGLTRRKSGRADLLVGPVAPTVGISRRKGQHAGALQMLEPTARRGAAVL